MRKINRREQKTLLSRVAGLCMSGWISLSVAVAEEMDGIHLDIDIDYTNDPFYTETWFLSLIALLLLFFLVQLIRGGKRGRRRLKAEKALKKALKESEEYQKETSNETEAGISETSSVKDQPYHAGEEN